MERRRLDLKKHKKAVTPVIATVLLIGMVIVIALIVFLWFRGLTQEAITKFDKNVELVCGEVNFEASYSNSEGTLAVSNIGNVPIYNMKVKISEEGDFKTESLNEISDDWQSAGLNPGRRFSGNINSYVTSANKIVITPVLVGTSESGERTYNCDDSRFGREINL